MSQLDTFALIRAKLEIIHKYEGIILECKEKIYAIELEIAEICKNMGEKDEVTE